MSPNIMKFSFFSLAYCIQQILAYPNGYSGGQPQQQVIVGQQTGFYSSDSNSNSIVGNFLPLRRTQNIKLGSIESRTPSPLCSVPNLHFGEPIQPLKLNPNVPQLAYKESAYFPVYKTANLPRCFARYTETAVRNLCWFQKRRVESLEVCLTLCLGAGMAFGTDCASATFHPASYTCRLYDKSLRAIEADAHMQYGCVTL